MFGTILISICTCMHIYVFWRTATVPLIVQHVPQKFLMGIGGALWLIFFFARVYGHHRTGIPAAALEFFGMNWMAVLFLLCICLLPIDVLTGFGFCLPRLAPTLRGWALVAGSILSTIALVQGLRAPIVRHYEVEIAGLPAQMDRSILVALSDLHIGSLIGKNWLAKRVDQVMEQQPDIVVLLGDIFEGHGTPQKGPIEVLQRLSAPLGVWAVPGNHEFHGGQDGNMSFFKTAGIKVLRNRRIQIRPGFFLAGIEDLTSMRRAGLSGDPVSLTFTGRPTGATVLLSHTPWNAEKAAGAGIGLMLSGHTHGGQIWPFGYLVQRVYPFLAGRYEVDGMTLIVCRGTGTWGPRMRLWHPSEILRVALRKK